MSESEIKRVRIQTAEPRGARYPGAVEEAHYTVQGDTVVLTDRKGVPIDKLQLSRELKPGQDAQHRGRSLTTVEATEEYGLQPAAALSATEILIIGGSLPFRRLPAGGLRPFPGSFISSAPGAPTGGGGRQLREMTDALVARLPPYFVTRGVTPKIRMNGKSAINPLF
jgi:hypothetical protein